MAQTRIPKSQLDASLANTSGTNTGDQDLSGLVPKTTTINSNDLTSNIVLDQDDIGDGTTYKQYSATEKTKLAGIEASADVTDVANVTTALNSISVDELSDVDTTTATPTDGQALVWDTDHWEPGTIAGSGAVDSVNSQTGVVVLDADDIDDTSTTNKFTTAGDISKLAGIETGADVTDATNVDAAGAVMNSDISTASMSFVVDEDNMVSDSATKVPTQQSVKAYVDANAGGAVDSVNSQTGVVVLDADDIDDTATTNKFVTASDLTNLGNLSGTNTGDQDLSGYELLSNKDTDTTLAANSDTRYPSQKAVKTYVDTAVTGLFDFKGSTDASTNPNYPAALKGDAYVVSVAGKVGGASGKNVDIGDVYFATADNAGGTEASVGTSWTVLEHNLAGALLSANNLSDLASAATALTNLGLTATATELNYTDGVTSSIQTQLDGKVNNTGSETIAGVKTFSSDPIVPDEAYGVGWNGSNEPPTKNAVYDKIETLSAGSGVTESKAIAYAVALG